MPLTPVLPIFAERRDRIRRLLAGAVTVAVLGALSGLAACRGLDEGAAGAGGGPASGPVTDCTGRPVAAAAPPRRVVTLTPSVLEMLFWLGVADRVVGTGVPPPPGTFPARFEAAAQRVPKLSGRYRAGAYRPVAREVLLSARPDFVLGGFASNFTAAGATGQDELRRRGIASYLALSTACDRAAGGPLTNLSLVERDLINLGRIFRVEDRARRLVAGLRTKTGQVTALARQRADSGAPKPPPSTKPKPPPSVFAFEYDEGTETPYAPGGRQTINAVITLAGGRNVFGDLDRAYGRVGWEEVVRRDPDVILCIVYGKGSAGADRAAFDRARRFLTAHPPLRNMRAVRERRFAELVYEDGSVGGVRNADAVVTLARQLHARPPGTEP
jgi:iron complex transport system substrate-binding protein